MLFSHFIVNLCAQEHVQTYTHGQTHSRLPSIAYTRSTDTDILGHVSVNSLSVNHLSVCSWAFTWLHQIRCVWLSLWFFHSSILASSIMLVTICTAQFLPPPPTVPHLFCLPVGLMVDLRVGQLDFPAVWHSAGDFFHLLPGVCKCYMSFVFHLILPFLENLSEFWMRKVQLHVWERGREIERERGSQTGSVASFQVDWILCLCVFMCVNFHVTSKHSKER